MNQLTEIAPGLYQSGTPDAVEVDVVVSLQIEPPAYLPASPSPEQLLVVWWPIADGPMPHADTVRTLAGFVVALLDQGKRVLVHCAGGNNRSGLVVARILMQRGATADEAIETIRRSIPTALNNQQFERWLREERLPDREPAPAD